MFRMEFHSLDAVKEDDDQARPHEDDDDDEVPVSKHSSSPPQIYEGRVGRIDRRMQRVASSNEAIHTVSHLPADLTITRTRSLNCQTSVPKDWVEVDLIDFSDPPKPSQSSTGEQEVIRELVKPFAESVNLTTNGDQHRAPIRDLLSNGVVEEAEGKEENIAAAVSSVESNRNGSLPVRTDSMPSSTYSTSSAQSSDTESSTSTTTAAEEKGSPASKSWNKAFNKEKKKMQQKKSKPVVGESKVAEPLLLVHEQGKMERKAQKGAKAEAKRVAEEVKRVAEEAKREAERQHRELRELANAFPESSMSQKNHGMLKGMNKLFHIHGSASHPNSPSLRGVHGDVREAKLVMPRAGLFEGSPGLSPSTTDVALAQIRTGPKPVLKSDLQFATVESHQRDVEPWTMEEYMAKNGRVEEWEKRKNDEEFGGLEGQQLLNPFFNNDDLVDDLVDDFNESDSD